MTIRNELLAQILIQYGGDSSGLFSRNQLLQAIISELGGTPDETLDRNGLLYQILFALGGSLPDGRSRNEILCEIVKASGGNPALCNNRNDLLGEWLLSIAFPVGDFPDINQTYYPEPIGGSTATQKYITELDGQDDYWLRGEPWRSTVSTITIEFVAPSSFSVNQYLYDTSGTDIRAYCLLNSGTGFIETNGTVIKLNGNAIANNSTAPVAGKINRLQISYSLVAGFFVGVDIFGARRNLIDFASFPILSIMLTDEENSANTYTYKLSSNLPYELPLGEEDISATTKITLQNSEPSGSDRILVTRKEDNSGFTDGTTDYDYAAGANP